MRARIVAGWHTPLRRVPKPSLLKIVLGMYGGKPAGSNRGLRSIWDQVLRGLPVYTTIVRRVGC